MVRYTSINKIKPLSSSVLTVGTFDGTHLGHQKVFSLVKSRANKLNTKAVVITFKPHPQHILRKPGHPLKKLLCSTDDKFSIMEKHGIDMAVILPFNSKLYHTSADDFLEKIIIEKFNPVEIVLGHDHHFGFQRKGDTDFLRSKSSNFGFTVDEVDPEFWNNEIISSTAIRELISLGDIKSAENMLGRKFAVTGSVVKGSGRGRQLSFPTANIIPDNDNMLTPGNGVYLVDVYREEKHYHGMCNIGIRPTFENGENRHIEVHLFEENIPDLYGENLRIEFISFIRNEDKFPTPSDLIEQIRRDREHCIEIIEENEI